MKNKLISLLAAMCMIIGILPQAVFASGTGSESDPITISSAEELKTITENVQSGKTYSGQYIKLTKDIDLSSVCGGSEGNWTPIGTSDKPFKGHFDGGHCTVKNLYISSPSSEYQGLFGYIEGAEVKNLKVEGSVTGNYRVGGVVGYNHQATVTNCAFGGTVTGSNEYVGGVVGYNLIGTVTGCYNTGAVTGYTYVGGVVGSNYNSSSTVTGCYNIGTVTCKASHIGGIAGSGGTVTGCYYLTGGGAGESKTKEQFSSGEVAYLLQKAAQGWGQSIGEDEYPVIGGEQVYFRYTDCVHSEYTNDSSKGKDTPYEHNFVNKECTVCGLYDLQPNSDGKYEIGTPGAMIAFAKLVNSGTTDAKAVMTADISVSTAEGYVPVGTDSNKFAGTFDGQNHTLTVALSGGDNTAPFAWVNGANISNLTVAGTVATANQYAAGFVGQAQGGVTLTNCLSSVTINSSTKNDGTHGGLIGVSKGTTIITNCGFNGAMNGSATHSCGGLVGWTDQSGTTAITNSYVAAGFAINVNNCDTFSRNSQYVTLKNCYYLTKLNSVKEGAVRLTADEFYSGRAAWLLNGSQPNGVWKQSIGSDSYPCFTGSPVYQSTCADNDFYGSSSESYAAHEYQNGLCIRCGAYMPLTKTGDVYKIGNAGQLFAFAQLVNNGEKTANAVLTADIDLNYKLWTVICATPLYNSKYGDDYGYSGTFDGAGYTISELTVSSSDEQPMSCGLFGTVSGTIKNLRVDGAKFIDNGYDYRMGAIVGQLITTDGHITNCCAANVVIPNNDHVTGVIAGCAYDATIENCMSYKSEAHGYNNQRYGHIVGDSRGDSSPDRAAKIRNCYTDGKRPCSLQSGTIENCVGGITEDRFKSGEIAHLLQDGQMEQVWGQTLSGDQIDAYPVIGGKKVYLQYRFCIAEYTNEAVEENTLTHDYQNGICSCCGGYEPLTKDADGAYQIRNAGQLKAFADIANNLSVKPADIKAVLMNDIDLSSVCGENKGSWTPIGVTGSLFEGVFDGKNHTIKGLYINSEMDYLGLFGYIADRAVVKNLHVEGNVTGKYDVGGIVGYNASSTVTGCSFSGSVTLKDTSSLGNVGGIVGMNSGTVTDCYNTGKVTSYAYAGGVVGYNSGTVKNCYSIGMVQCSGTQTYVGGVTGQNSGTISNCYYLTGTAAGGIKSQDTAGMAEVKNEAEFASGEVAWLLNGTKADGVWKQTLSTDAYPSFTGLTVYYDAERTNPYYNEITYTNTVLKKVEPADTKDASSATAVLSQINPNGNAITHITWTYTAADDEQSAYTAEYTEEISGDSTLYFGIVVPALLSAQDNEKTEDIKVTIN